MLFAYYKSSHLVQSVSFKFLDMWDAADYYDLAYFAGTTICMYFVHERGCI